MEKNILSSSTRDSDTERVKMMVTDPQDELFDVKKTLNSRCLDVESFYYF